MTITVTGDTIFDIKMKLGFRAADIRIGLDNTPQGKVQITVESPTGPFTFFKVKPAVTHIAGLLIAHEMRLIARARKETESLKRLVRRTRGGKKRTLRPKAERRKRNGFRTPERRGR